MLIMGITVYIAFMYGSTAMMLLFFVEAALFAVAFFSMVFRCFKIRGYIEVPVGIAERDGESLVKLVISNRGLMPVNRLQALVVVKDVMRGRKRRYRMTLPTVPKGESEYIRSVSFPDTGNYEITLHRLKIYDISGVLSWSIPVKKQGSVQIMPEIHDVPVRLSSATKNFYGEAEVYDENQPGYDKSELFQVREYRPGDRVQNVHWKLAAKLDELIVRNIPCRKHVRFFCFYLIDRKEKNSFCIFWKRWQVFLFPLWMQDALTM